jgi:hypothetical protein
MGDSSGGANGNPLAAVTMTIPTDNFVNQSLVIAGFTADVNGNGSPDGDGPIREDWIYGAQGTRIVTSDTTQLPTDGLLLCDPSGLAQPTATALAGDINAATLAIPVAAGDNVTNGAYIQIANERILILSGAVPGPCTLTAQGRGGWGTTPAAHSNGDPVSVPAGLTVQLLPADDVPRQQLTVTKDNPQAADVANLSDLNFVKIVAGGADVLPGGGTTEILPDSAALGSALIIFPGAQ